MRLLLRWWPFAGGIAGFALGIVFLVRLDRPQLYFWLFLALLMLHHFEEVA